MNNNEDWCKTLPAECRLLYSQIDKPCTETCMCWGFECGDGWKYPISDLSYQLEALNLTYYPKYKIRIQADQVKEKFGTLRFYYSVVSDRESLFNFISRMFSKAAKCIKHHIRFDCVPIITRDAYKEDVVETLTKEKWEEQKSRYANYSNVRFTETDGEYKMITIVEHCRQVKYTPTRHKFLYWLMNVCNSISRKTYVSREPTAEETVIVNALQEIARKLVYEAEQECYNRCEKCGRTIGNEYSPRCTTTGWIKHICEKCADKTDQPYYIDGKLVSGKRKDDETNPVQEKPEK